MDAEQQQKNRRGQWLKQLSDKLKQMTVDLDNILMPAWPREKWEWPEEVMAIVHQMRKLGEDNIDEVRETLDPLFAWPNKESANPEKFYNSEPPFDRTHDWFEKMGFSKYQTPYTFTANWDAAEVLATFLVPNNLEPGDKCPVVWFFHGGGFVSAPNV